MNQGTIISYQDHCRTCRRPCSTVAKSNRNGTSTVHRSDCCNAPIYAQRAPEAIGTTLVVES